MSSEVEAFWLKNQEGIINIAKVYLLKEHVEDILVMFNIRIQSIVRRYARYLPSFVVESEIDDLKTIAQLELIETFKIWNPDKNDSIWPLAQLRITGAMKDHIRFITKSDPSRLYDWITDAAYIYETVNSSANFESKYETGEELSKVMEVLDERERKVVIAHAQSDLTFKVIGDRIGISESQISRIYKKAIEKMKKELKKQSDD